MKDHLRDIVEMNAKRPFYVRYFPEIVLGLCGVGFSIFIAMVAK